MFNPDEITVKTIYPAARAKRVNNNAVTIEREPGFALITRPTELGAWDAAARHIKHVVYLADVAKTAAYLGVEKVAIDAVREGCS